MMFENEKSKMKIENKKSETGNGDISGWYRKPTDINEVKEIMRLNDMADNLVENMINKLDLLVTTTQSGKIVVGDAHKCPVCGTRNYCPIHNYGYKKWFDSMRKMVMIIEKNKGDGNDG